MCLAWQKPQDLHKSRLIILYTWKHFFANETEIFLWWNNPFVWVRIFLSPDQQIHIVFLCRVTFFLCFSFLCRSLNNLCFSMFCYSIDAELASREKPSRPPTVQVFCYICFLNNIEIPSLKGWCVFYRSSFRNSKVLRTQ